MLIAHTWDFPMTFNFSLLLLKNLSDRFRSFLRSMIRSKIANKTVFEHVYSENHQELQEFQLFALGVLSIEKTRVESEHAQLLRFSKSLQHDFKKRMQTATNQIRLRLDTCVYADLIGQYLTSAFSRSSKMTVM